MSSSISETINKAFVRGSEWADKDDLLDVVYWGKQVLALVIGIASGLLPAHGLLAIVMYVAISTLVAHYYVTQFQNMDEEAMGGFFEVAKEGFGSALATFMVSWIGIYSCVHHS
uniref:Rab5-interacting protein n=1 Tax=Steinernema glaseri TaxID=37863 RepID=A0A1I7ZK04_9BILA